MANKRKTTGVSGTLFEDVDPYGAVIGKPTSKPVERFPLDTIWPDPDQPRRLLPGNLAEKVDQGKLTQAEAASEWLEQSETEPDSATATKIRELQRLAKSIEQHGLINPITIRPVLLEEDRYIIVTGERRYWAHVLLSLEGLEIQEGKQAQASDKIKATLVPEGSSIRAHQIVENLIREDINVVEKAHGIWALRRELSDDAYRRQSAPEASKKPRLVSWKDVEEKLGMSRQYRGRIIAVLGLSEEAQQIIKQNSLAEATIRPIVEGLKGRSDLQVQALHQLIQWQQAEAEGKGKGRRIVPSVGALVNKLLSSSNAGASVSQPQSLDFGKFQQKVRGVLRYIQKLDDAAITDFARISENETGADIVDELEALRDQIDEMLRTVSDQRKDVQ